VPSEPTPGSAAPRVSLVVVTWNSRDVLPALLDSLVADPPAVPWEAIVVDNGSTDETVGAARAHPAGPRVIANPANRGLAAANNQGIAAAAGEFLIIANPDTEVTAGAIDALLEAAGRRPRAAMIVPRLRYPDGRPQTSAGDLPTLATALLGRQGQALGRGRSRGFWWDDWEHDCEVEIGRGHESFYLVRTEALADIGLQDEGFALDWEGVDWAARAHEAGWQVWFTPEASIVHASGSSIRQVPMRWIVGSHRGMYRYFAKRSSRLLHPLLALVVAARGAVKALGAVAGPATYERSHRR
jgi:N-acetylglucosaminyl-diphospho-decaprenol L-rhamnosyltransferase